MIKAILTTIFVCVVMSGCIGKSDKEKMSEAKAISACRDKGGLANFDIRGVFIGPLFNIATCKNGDRVDYTNETGPSVAEAFKSIDYEIYGSASDEVRKECDSNKGLRKVSVSHSKVVLTCKDNREITLIDLYPNTKKVNK